MAVSMSVDSTNRCHISQFLKGSHLSVKFLRNFTEQDDVSRVAHEAKEKAQKSKGKLKEPKLISQRDKSPETSDVCPPLLELHSTPSSYSVYSSVRQSVLEQQVRAAARIFQSARQAAPGSTDAEDDDEKAKYASMVKMPKIVGIGLCGVFELIRETRVTHSVLCTRALQALLDMLQGHRPEEMKHEPTEVTDSLYHLLMEIAGKPCADNSTSCYSLSAVACQCLISLIIAEGDTGKLLGAVAAMLMSPPSLAAQDVRVPAIMCSLQRSIHSVLLGRTLYPDWSNRGVPDQSLTFSFPVRRPKASSTSSLEDCTDSALASDGKYLYLLNQEGLHKIGSGYGSTIKGFVYVFRPASHMKPRGWLSYTKGQLFYRSLDSASSSVAVINTETLEEEKAVMLEGNNYGCTTMFSNGECIGRLVPNKDDSFVVRMYSPICDPMALVSEIPLKLARRCLDVMGSSSLDAQKELHNISNGVDEDVASISAGKEFCLVRTSSGKILFTGKASVLGIKHGGPVAGKWAELPVTKSPRIVQYSVGHDGMHALLVSEDGSVFFTGTPKRGEDGDSTLGEGRRALKPSKPKKIIKMEGRHVVSSACNYGTSAMVTKEGEIYMFGKDSTHCDHTNGLVTDLKEVHICQVQLGKAHAVALSNRGQVYSFGLNNKGQCGRDMTPVPLAREASGNVAMASEEEDAELDDVMCLPGTHKWKRQECMVCTLCGECTGYGVTCINSGLPSRNPGQPCGCGSGDSGCEECGCCHTCAGEPAEMDREDVGILEAIAKNKDALPFELLFGRHGARGIDQLAKKMDDRRQKTRPSKVVSKSLEKVKVAEPMSGLSAGPSSSSTGAGDMEPDHSKMVSLPPAAVTVGNSDARVIQISCGLHHTVLLLESHEVYTFGNNQYGQLGVGDLTTRGTAVRVPISGKVVQVAAGSTHTVLLTSLGTVYTYGAFQKGQLGRSAPEDGTGKDKKKYWFATPGPVPGIGAKFGRRATWVGASADQTFMKIDESLINAHTLSRSNIFANQSCIGLIPSGEDLPSNIKCLMIKTTDGSCQSFTGSSQADLSRHSVCLDVHYNVLWSYSPVKKQIYCYDLMRSEVKQSAPDSKHLEAILNPELAVPSLPGTITSRSNLALYLLACLDTLTHAHKLGLNVCDEEKDRHQTSKVLTKEDFSVVNRFKSHGGGWGYTDHSVEAIRFSCDTDILLGGFGLFGGRGLYFGKIKVFDLGSDGGENESYGDLLAETDEIPFECGAREKYPILFDEPVPLQSNSWYCAWARVSGPSSDCGSSGQSIVTADDQVVFKFKSSKKSNNGTDIISGQIPQLLYRLPSHDSGVSGKKLFSPEHTHILSQEFSRTVVPECFESLLRLLHWSWNTFSALLLEITELQGTNMTAALLDLDRLVYITTATLRLISTYICELYPITVCKRTPPETSKLAECVGEVRALLRRILAENRPATNARKHQHHGNQVPRYVLLSRQIADECYQTFVACFHAFYPTATLKWACLCDLLNILDPNYHDVDGLSRLLSAVLEALCYPTVKLIHVLPINCDSYHTEFLLKQQPYKNDDNQGELSRNGDLTCYPHLVQHMTHRTDAEGMLNVHHNFKEILDKLLSIVVLPVRQAMKKERVIYPEVLVFNACSLIIAVVSELIATATGNETESHASSRPLYTSPNRFTRMSQNAYWNPGNGNPDAVCFSVDRSGIVIAGIGVYGGGSHYDYELELLDEQVEAGHDPQHTQRWNNVQAAKGSYGADDCINNIAELRFERPIAIKEGVKYALRLRNHGSRTYNGDGGQSKVKCPDGTTFTFSACSLSINGTNPTRGQIPHILYYSSPQDGENRQQNSKALAEHQARKNALSIIGATVRAAADLLNRAQGLMDVPSLQVVNASHVYSVLLPLLFSYVGPIAAQDPRSAVQILILVQEILPAVSGLNCRLHQSSSSPPSPHRHLLSSGDNNGTSAALADVGTMITGGAPSTTSQHYAMVESDHPYKPATVANFVVKFPGSVCWVTVEFDPMCGTAQLEDSLQLYIPARQLRHADPKSAQDRHPDLRDCCPVLKKFYGLNNWPSQALVLPGNEVIFSLETASDYVKDDKACFYGFKCTVVGYEWPDRKEEGLGQLEKAIVFLGGMSASSLIRKDIVLPSVSMDDCEEDLECIEENAEQVFQIHASLLGKGFALSHPLNISQALEGSLPFSWQSNERSFLIDFVACTSGTSGGRLARWLQPDSYLDRSRCLLVYSPDDLRCSWPTTLTLCTKDQYGNLVNVPNLRIETKAIPCVSKDGPDEHKKVRLQSRQDEVTNATFGGHPPPRLDVPYDPTIKDKKDVYHSICMMKAYENYSFEELRFMCPSIRRPSENMLVRSNNNGTYALSWTPCSVGLYTVQVTIDGHDMGDAHKVEVKEAPQGVLPPAQTLTLKKRSAKLRKFVAKFSNGLRVRQNPSLQSEQIGLIKPGGTIGFSDELHNDDGVWIRLTDDSMHKWCSNGHSEAWALQYNQHLGKTLLVPADEQPKSLRGDTAGTIKEVPTPRSPLPTPSTSKEARQTKRAGAGAYHVVKCGASGHNIRSRPSMKATPIGMLVIGNQVIVINDYVNSEGSWVQLSKASQQHYCHESEGEAWSLARGLDDMVYLEHEADVAKRPPDQRGGQGVFGCLGNAFVDDGFDFSGASQQVPMLTGFGEKSQAESEARAPPFARVQNQPMMNKAPARDPEFDLGAHAHGGAGMMNGFLTNNEVNMERAKQLDRAAAEGVDAEPPIAAAAAAAAPSLPRMAGIPPPPPPATPSPLVSTSPAPVERTDIPPELVGVSVKDLVKALGESRANGNGVTPPGTPKKSSRSSSPMPIPGQTTVSGSSSVKSSSATSSPLPLHSPRRESLPVDIGRKFEGGASSSLYSTPPQTPPTARTPSARSTPVDSSPNFGSPPNQRSPLTTSPVPIRANYDSPPNQRSPLTTSPVPIRAKFQPSEAHFNIGVSPPKDESRQSPKVARKDRSRHLRSKRGSSPGSRDKSTPTSISTSATSSLERRHDHMVKEALSPSVAECLRAVFAAFLWHEGIVHDAMACASFIKFHPAMSKDSQCSSRSSTLERKQEKIKNRHSADVAIGDTRMLLEEVKLKVTENRNLNRNQLQENKIDSFQSLRDRHRSEGDGLNSDPDSMDDGDSELPPTLQDLVSLWEELKQLSLKVIKQNLILPSPAMSLTRSRKSEVKKEKEKPEKDKRGKKKKTDVKSAANAASVRGNLFGDAAASVEGRGADRESTCELCGGVFPYPVTYHMRQAHPGCGQHADGQGYNSAGHFCGGWAGNCGDGGIGGSSWYLICNRCREKFLKDKRQVLKDKQKKSKKKNVPLRQAALLHPLEPHIVMKNNAMFLLDLASSTGYSIPTKRKHEAHHHNDNLPCVSEHLVLEQGPFPQVPFLYLHHRGAENSDSAFSAEVIYNSEEEVIYKDGDHYHTIDSPDGGARPRLGSDTKRCVRHNFHQNHISPQEDCLTERPSLKPLHRSAQVSPESDSEISRKSAFHRSISEVSKSDQYSSNDENGSLRVIMRRRNVSGGVTDGGMSLLKHPSAAMSKLTQCAEMGSMPSGSDRPMQRPVMAFIMQRHDLEGLQLAMRQSLRKAACRVYAFQALNWLVRSTSQTTCIHDLLWFFVASLLPPVMEPDDDEAGGDRKKDRKDVEQIKHERDRVCEHPMSDISIAGDMATLLEAAYQTFLQTISDVMMHLPSGSTVQQLAVRCWYLKFRQTDHLFLHKSHVFSNISKILSKSDEENDEAAILIVDTTPQSSSQISALVDLVHVVEIKASSRQAMVNSLTDNSTETFWESGDEDRNKSKYLSLTCDNQASAQVVYIHIDNTRDLGNKVSNITFHCGPNNDELKRLKQVEIDTRHIGWVRCELLYINAAPNRVIRLELKGPDNTLRVRQLKILGSIDSQDNRLRGQLSTAVMQQRNCEAETLKVFRLLTSLVFGRLISDDGDYDDRRQDDLREESIESSLEGENDLKEHMVSILFSRSKLSHLQKQVCAHIVQAIRKETSRVRDEWELGLSNKQRHLSENERSTDSYCFELLSMVLALSGSAVGRVYLAQQHDLLQDLLSLLHTATPRVQRQVTSLLRRVLPDVSPQRLAAILSIKHLPPKDFSIMSNVAKNTELSSRGSRTPGILDVFLSCIAKALTVQMKVKNGSGKGVTSINLAECITSRDTRESRWWLRGRVSSKLASSIVKLLKDMSSGKLSDAWASVTKGAIAEMVLSLTKLEDNYRAPTECIKTSSLWLALASLCVLDADHVDRLSSGLWTTGQDGQANHQRPTCDNHDDSETLAIILCTACGNLCADCDRFLHLHRRTRNHQRQVFKEEEESIKVDLHEGCGRIKLFWVMALADSKTLKAMVEFRESAKVKIGQQQKLGTSMGTCRFCGTQDNTGILAIGNVCSDPDCQAHSKMACTKQHPCGHACSGIRDEAPCLPCLHGCANNGHGKLRQDADDMCMICFTEALANAPSIELSCGHVFHYHCCRKVLARRWVGPRITFGFCKCPICKADIEHSVLSDLLNPIHALYEDVRRKALMRIEYEGLHKAEAITNPGARFYNDPAAFAMERYAYYVCYKCKKAYYGGEARCDEQAENADDYNPAELVCGACSDVARAQMCPKHGTDFLEYKCRYCCSVAVFFCFGTTHFCNACHDDFQRVTNIPRAELPHCPAGSKGKQLEGDECPLHVNHPPTGEEFALGCGVCRNAHTF